MFFQDHQINPKLFYKLFLVCKLFQYMPCAYNNPCAISGPTGMDTLSA
ncbi:hypothetical protein HMPREF6485_2698 [Segatella buccae ATCC 33574]|uniref:Uncharacterized protein n=1 Tax=Segatella buccae ATCC 33574 TaxID=873513 RepID=E6KAR2_9BACT|nr:hypothetical protein HMPREF6485_2698 [Segatella buccae ATCC 33574]